MNEAKALSGLGSIECFRGGDLEGWQWGCVEILKAHAKRKKARSCRPSSGILMQADQRSRSTLRAKGTEGRVVNVPLASTV